MFSLNLVTPFGDAPILTSYEGPVPREGEIVRIAGYPFIVGEVEYQLAPAKDGAAYKLRAVDVYLKQAEGRN